MDSIDIARFRTAMDRFQAIIDAFPLDTTEEQFRDACHKRAMLLSVSWVGISKVLEECEKTRDFQERSAGYIPCDRDGDGFSPAD